MINFKGDLFGIAISFGGMALLRLVSTIILTRLLYPEAYGIVTIVASIAYLVEMLSDVGVLGLMVRHERADEQRFINTMWTIRMARSLLNGAIVFLLAPFFATLYDSPPLAEALRIFSVFFLFQAVESMSFALAVRRRQARTVSYCELTAAVVTTLFTVGFSYFWRDWRGMVIGMVLNRALMAAMSYRFFRSERPRLQFDREVFKASMGFAKYVAPSNLIAVVMAQFDKFIFLKLFDIRLLGLYGLAGNIVGMVDSLVLRVTRSVLFPRCAENFRRDPATVRDKYYHENVRLTLFILFLPAALGGASNLLVHVLFDPRYAYAAVIVRAFALRSAIAALADQAENLLLATGTQRPALLGNVLRIGWLVPGSLLGHAVAGFEGFLYMASLQGLPALVYFVWLQRRRGLLIARYEAMKLGYLAAVFLLSLLVSTQLVVFVDRLR